MFFFVLVYVIFVQYSKHCSKNIRDRSNIINYIDKNIECTSTVHARASPETSTYEVARDVSRKLQLTLCAIMAS